MKNKKLLAFALSMAVAAGCTACGGGQASTDTSAAGSSDSTQAESSATGDNTVIVAMGSGFSTLDPGYVYEKYPQLIVNACYENLFKFYENNGTPQPCLADTYEFSEDGLTLTVKLKDGLTFASGNKITSADVAFSINRTKNLKGNPSFICDTIESIETPDDATVIFHLNQPDSAILSKLTYSSLAVLDSAVVKENGGTDAEDASSTDTGSMKMDLEQLSILHAALLQRIVRRNTQSLVQSTLQKHPDRQLLIWLQILTVFCKTEQGTAVYREENKILFFSGMW